MTLQVDREPTVEFFFDCSSPWTYLAYESIIKLATELKFDIIWRPFLVGVVFNTVNASVYNSRTNSVPAKDAYLGKDLRDWADAIGLSIRFPPSIFPVNSAKAMRGCIVAQSQGKMPSFGRAIFETYWRDDRDISQPAVLAGIAGSVGLSSPEFLTAIDQPAAKQSLRDNTDDLIKRGGFGSPTIFVDGTDMYFGNDRIVLVRRAIEMARSRRAVGA